MSDRAGAPDLAGVARAAMRLGGVMDETPLIRSEPLCAMFGAEVWLKLETLTPIGSFKLRGAANALMSNPGFPGTNGAYTSSTGNHGQGVALAARLLGGEAHVFLPERPNPAKKAKIEALGARVVEAGANFDEAKAAALDECERKGGLFIDDGEDPEVMNGAGTIGYEIARRFDRLDAVIVPMGGGCLAGGVGLAIKALHPAARIIGVQSEGAPAMHLSYQAKKPIEAPVTTLAESLALGVPPALNLEQIIESLDDTRLVSDDELFAAAKTLMLRAHILAEPGAAAGLAALLHWRGEFAGKTIVLVISGANLDEDTLARVVRAPTAE